MSDFSLPCKFILKPVLVTFAKTSDMTECYGSYFIHNGKLQPSEIFDNSLVYEGESVYEVLRMTSGIPWFFNDHLNRLRGSAKSRKKVMLATPEQIKGDIALLSKAEKKKEVNLKLVFNYNGRTGNYLLYYIEPVYPDREQYEKGVKGVLFHAERKDPETKIINHKLRSEIYHKLILETAYEALLVNREGLITEGSRSNIFFIRDNVLYTAPDKMVLGGITRKHILDISTETGIKVVFEAVKESEIKRFESVFMTGTSPIVLPFRLIGNISFDVSNPVMPELRKLYIRMAEKSMEEFGR